MPIFPDFQHIQTPENTVLAGTDTYPTIQEAIDYGETLAAADTSEGVGILIPPGLFSEDLIIRKNISLIGQGLNCTYIKSITYRPISALAGPIASTVKNITLNNSDPGPPLCLIVDNETATSSGIFYDQLFDGGGLIFDGCSIETGVSLKGSAGLISFVNSIVAGAGCQSTNCINIRMRSSDFSDFTVISDDTLSGLPLDYVLDGGSFFDIAYSYTAGTLTLTTAAGTTPSSVIMDTGYVENLVANDNTNIYVYSGGIGTRTLVGGTHTIGSYTGNTPFKPTTPGDWTTSPEKVDSALDELAARSSGGVSDGDKGDVVVSGSGATWTVDTDVIGNTKLANMATKTYKGRTSGTTGDPEDVAVATLKTDLGLVKGDVGLGNVDNTSDVNKPVSTAQQTAIDGKVSDTAYNATSWDAVTTIAPSKNAVRDQVETLQTNIDAKVSDTAYDATTWDGVTTIAPSKNAIRDKIEILAPLASPALTGTPTAPTASAVTNNTQIATTAYADALVSDTAYNATSWNSVTGIAPSKNAVRDQIELLAPLASPALTGTPTAPTAAAATNNTQVATTAYADALVSNTAYDATSWNSVSGIAPSKDAVRDQIEQMISRSLSYSSLRG